MPSILISDVCSLEVKVGDYPNKLRCVKESSKVDESNKQDSVLTYYTCYENLLNILKTYSGTEESEKYLLLDSSGGIILL